MKRFYLIIALLLPLAAHAQYPGAQLEINTADGVYEVGDSIKVWATVFEGCSPVLEFTVQKNMKTELSKKTVTLKEGRHLLYSEVCREPAHYVYLLGIPGTKKAGEKASSVGAIVSHKSFRAGYAAPKDLRKFWDKQIAKMRKMPLTVESKAAPQEKYDQTGYTCLDIEIPMPEGNPVRAYLVYPSDAAEGSLPIVIRAHAAGVKGPWCRCSTDKTIDDAKRGGGAIALDINAHGMLNGQPDSYYENLDSGELLKYSSRDFSGHNDFYFRLMYLRLVRAIDYLVTLPQWDGKRIAILGESQGGAQAAALAGIDNRITAASLRVPAFMDVAGKFDDRAGSWPHAYGRKAEELGHILPYYDAACLLTMTRAKLFFEAGLTDYTCPPACVAAGYNNAPVEDKTIVFFPYRPHTLGSAMDKRFLPRWKEEIQKPREQWLNDYLK